MPGQIVIPFILYTVFPLHLRSCIHTLWGAVPVWGSTLAVQVLPAYLMPRPEKRLLKRATWPPESTMRC